jgi:hypothetical protein
MVWFGSGDYGFGLATYLLILLDHVGHVRRNRQLLLQVLVMI